MLPLRLAAEPVLRSVIGSACFILPSLDEDKLCYVISNSGLIAFVMNQEQSHEDITNFTNLQQSNWPRYSVIRHDSDFYWYFQGNQCETIPSKDAIMQSVNDQTITRSVARALLESITRYYSRQVLEPSIRGFLGILEKQFPRNDLYLFELLQNAVDDGAAIVIMKSFDLNSTSPGLFFCHNGRSFSPLDILGLASVGLSTKGTEDKKKIGFMGVGFKAVYKRFGSVTIYDHVWSLQFREPTTVSLIEPSHSWVLKPNWIEHYTPLDSLIPNSEKMFSQSWCHFILQNPRGGVNAIKSDLSHLSINVPVLLGRQFLFSRDSTFPTPPTTEASSSTASISLLPSSPQDWTLIWEDKKYFVTCHEKHPHHSGKYLERLCEPTFGIFVGGMFDRVRISISSFSQRNKIENKLFQFLTVSYHPTRRAQEAFEIHTKKKWSTQASLATFDGKNQHLTEDISIFFEIGTDGFPIVNTRSGKIHAILPTKLLMPCTLNLQASWLLSVDRQDVQNVSDNDWNNCLINQIPRLLVLLSRWIAQQVHLINSSTDISLSLRSFYLLFPKFIFEESELQLQLMNQLIPMKELLLAFKEEQLIPARSLSTQNNCQNQSDSNSESIIFCRQSETIWLPAPMMKFLSAKVIYSWFARWPFISQEIGDLSLDLIWIKSLTLPTIDILYKRRASFRIDESVKKSMNMKIKEALTILAAFGTIQQNETKEIYEALIPTLQHWPIFLTESGESVTAQEIVWLNPDEFNSTLDDSIFITLRKGALLATLPIVDQIPSTTTSASFTSSRFTKGKTVPINQTFLLDTDLEQVLRQDSHPNISPNILSLAKDCVKSAQLLSPSRVIGVDASCRAILTMIAREQNEINYTLDIPLIHDLFHWAMKNSRHAAISHLLVSKSSGLKLIPSNEAYIRTSNSSSSQAFDFLPYVSDNYLHNLLPGDPRYQNFHNFLIKCGCQTGLSLVARIRSMSSSDKSYLLNGELPKLRQSNPSIPLFLPFNLGPLTRKKVEIIDVQLSSEWEIILKNASNDISLAENVAEMICQVLVHIDTAPTVTAQSTPYLKNLFQGRAEDMNYESNYQNSSHRIPSDIEMFAPPGFARMFYLPPAQPGAEVRNLGPAEWISRIARSKWVPAIPAGSDENDLPSLIVAPCEVMLTKEKNSPLSDIMPLAKLLDSQIRIFQAMNPLLMSLFAWGTVAPPPPLEQFESLCQHQITEIEEGNNFGIISCSRHKYLEIANLWISLLLAFKENRLTSREKSRILKALKLNQHSKLFIIPGYTKNTLLSISRCVMTTSSNSERDEDIVTSLLCQLGFLFDLNVENSLDEQWILSSYRSSLAELLSLPKFATLNHLNEYLINSFSSISPPNRPQPPTNVQSLAFTYSLWLLAKDQLTSTEIESLSRSKISPSSQIIEKVRCDFKQRFLHFAVYCTSGFGLENSNVPGEWIVLWSNTITPSKIRPVLIDDHHHGLKGCGVLKSSLLKSEHHFKPVAILDHTNNHSQSSSHLLNIEMFLRAVLDIPSISDSNYFSISARSGNIQEPLHESAEKFQVIIGLLHLLDYRNIQTSVAVSIAKSPIFKCSILNLIFRYPKFVDEKLIGLSEISTIPVYAIRGAPIQIKSSNNQQQDSINQKIQSLLITGNPADYVPELEELILLLLYGNHRPVISSNVRKALSLLHHLESDFEFLKYYDRYFQDLVALNLEKTLENEEEKSTNHHQELIEAIKIIKNRENTRIQAQLDLATKGQNQTNPPPLPPLPLPPPPHGSFTLRETQQNTNQLLETKVDIVEIEKKNLGAAECFLSSISSLSTAPVPSISSIPTPTPPPILPLLPLPPRGQSRGVCNLPSWMTVIGNQPNSEDNTDILHESQLSKKRPLEEVENPSKEVDKGDDKHQNQNEDEDDVSHVKCNSVPLPILQTTTDVVLHPIREELIEISRGRGRGLSNLPAWMTVQNSIEEILPDKKRPRVLDETQFEDVVPTVPLSAVPQKVTIPFQYLLEDLFELISQSAKYSVPLSSTISKIMVMIVTSLSDDQKVELENLLSGPLQQELLSALQVVQNSSLVLSSASPPSGETQVVPRFHHLQNFLTRNQT